MFVFVMLSCLFLAALILPAGERADLLALVCNVFLCFVTFLYGVPGVVHDCIDS